MAVAHWSRSWRTGRYERSKDATNGAPGLTTRSKKLLGAKGIATRSKDASRFFYFCLNSFVGGVLACGKKTCSSRCFAPD